MNEKAERVEKVEKAEKAERVEKIERAERVGKAERVEKAELRKRLHKKMREGRMGNLKPRNNFMNHYAMHKKLPDLSSLRSLSDRELAMMSSMTGLSSDQIKELSKMVEVKPKINNPDIGSVLSEEERKNYRSDFVNKLADQGRFKNGSDQELNLVYSFMDRLRSERVKEMTEEQKDKLRAMIILYHRLHGLGPKTPGLEEWSEYGIHPDEIITKTTFQVSYPRVPKEEGEEEAELSDLSSD